MSRTWQLTGSPNGMLTAVCKRCGQECTYPNYSDVATWRAEHDNDHEEGDN